jgi:hypothetical protein
MTPTTNDVEPTTSATEELRRLLDERGVEWHERVWSGKRSVTTFWNARGVRWHYRENRFGELRLHADGLAPEQAIAATLGRGACRMEYCLELSYDELYPTEAYQCSACGEVTVEGKPNYCPSCGAKVVDE